jgi:serine/threonine protein kinase
VLEREAQTWVQLGPQPNVVSCHYVRRVDEIPRVFIEHVSGGDLAQFIRSRQLYADGPQSALKQILDIAIQSAWGLHHAHEHRMIHQDMKPANVLMTTDGVAKVTDFGLATMQAQEGGGGGTLVAGVTGHTPLYASPEQAAKGQLTRRTDIWRWAVSVLEMFMGERTWPIGSVAGYYLEQLRDTGPSDASLPVLPSPFASLLGECFNEDEAARPRTFLAIAQRLTNMYSMFVGEPYPREPFSVAGVQCDNYNNRALSLLDLGKLDLAREAWTAGLRLDATPPALCLQLVSGSLASWRAR